MVLARFLFDRLYAGMAYAVGKFCASGFSRFEFRPCFMLAWLMQ